MMSVRLGEVKVCDGNARLRKDEIRDMDYYHGWFNLKDSHKDLEFCGAVARYLGHLKQHGLIEGHQLTRRKLGFGPPSLGEFNITIVVRDMAQLEETFQRVARRDPEIERLHAAVYLAVKDVQFALYRDYPDKVREQPEEDRNA